MSATEQTIRKENQGNNELAVWASRLTDLCAALNEAAQNGRKFNREKYRDFLVKLSRIGIHYKIESGKFFLESSSWEETLENDVNKEAKVLAAAASRFKFQEELPAYNLEWTSFNDAAPKEIEKELSNALRLVKEFRSEYDHLFRPGSKYHANTASKRVSSEKKSNEAKGISSLQQALKDYQEHKIPASSENETTLTHKLNALNALIAIIEQHMEQLDADSQEKMKVILKEINQVKVRIQENKALLEDHVNRATSQTIILLTTTNRLTSRLLAFAENIATEHRHDSALLFEDVRVNIVYLQEAVLNVIEENRKNSLIEKAVYMKNTLLPNKHVTKKAIAGLQRTQKDRGEIASFIEDNPNQINEITREAQRLNNNKEPIDIEILSLSDQLIQAQNQAATAKSEQENIAEKKEKMLEKLAKVREERGNNQNELINKLFDADISFDQNHVSSVRKALLNAINELIKNHKFLSNDSKSEFFKRKFGGKTVADQKLAEKLVEIKSLLEKAATLDEISAVCFALEKAIILFETQEQYQSKQSSSTRKDALYCLKAACVAESLILESFSLEQHLTEILESFNGIERRADEAVEAAEKPLLKLQEDLSRVKHESANLLSQITAAVDKREALIEEQEQATEQLSTFPSQERLQSDLSQLQRRKAAINNTVKETALEMTSLGQELKAIHDEKASLREEVCRIKGVQASLEEASVNHSIHQMRQATQVALQSLQPSTPAVPLDVRASQNPYGQFHHPQTDEPAKSTERKLVLAGGRPQ